jgi:hypothetical protein
MRKKSIVAIEFDTRQRMKELAKKSQTYDSFLNDLFDKMEANKKG